MGGLFGKHKKEEGHGHGEPEITAHDQAVLDLKLQRDKLKRHKKKLNRNAMQLQGMAKELLRDGRRDRALLLLKKKKVMTSKVAEVEGMLDNVQELTDSLEFASVQAEVVASLRSGADALKTINATMDIDEVERIMDDTQEAVDYQNELSNALAGLISPAEEDDLEDELDALIAEGDAGVVGQLPDVPTTDPVGSDVGSDVEVPAGASTRTRARVAAT